MKIDPERLSRLRKEKRLTRPQLAKRSEITERTIQRLENEPQRCQKSREDTLNRLAKALGVEPGVLTGDLPLPESDKAPDPKFVQIGAQIAPKARLAYDLIKRRYGVRATEIINMAPLFFALLAEGSLAWRSEKIEEAEEAKSRLGEIDGFWRGSLVSGEITLDFGIAAEQASIDKADLFGEHLFSNADTTFIDVDDLFDPSKDNPFASYLRELKAKLAISGIVDVDSGGTRFGAPLKFPDYDICRDELDSIANGSARAKMALETGYARLSEIPEELRAEDAGEERAKWLEDRLPGTFKGILEKEGGDIIVEIVAKDPEGDLKKLIEEAESQKTNSNIEEGEDDQ